MLKKAFIKFNYIKKDLNSRNIFYAFASNILYSVLGFLGIALLARSLPVSQYGDWIIYLSANSLLEMMRLGFIHTALVRYSSGSNEIQQKQYIASAWIIGLIISFSLSTIVFIGFLLVDFFQIKTSYHYFLLYYPILGIIGFPLSIASSILQFKSQFAKVLLLRFTIVGLNLMAFIYSYLFKLQIESVILLHLLSNITACLITILLKWSGLEHIHHFTREKINQLSNFGKYSIGTLIGTNLLKSADTFILGFSIGGNSVALYSIPLKLTETFEILLRSIVSIALPKMSNYSQNSQEKEIKRLFENYSGILSFIYIPLMLFCFVFAEFLLQILGGSQYLVMSNVFRIFCFYGLLLPIDRFTGVTLDCMNLPFYNFKKVIFMCLFNISWDIIVINFTTDLKWIAFGTVLTTILGITVGLKFLNKSFQTNLSDILKSGLFFLKKNKLLLYK